MTGMEPRRFWWVNQNQTFDQEVGGGYLWSPKRRSDGAKNRFYENMREVAPGDIIFSFAGRQIRAIGTALSHALECPKPEEFGSAGPNWDKIGWKVDVIFSRKINPIRPKDHIAVLRYLLPPKYSPLQTTGDGIQSVYLAEISQDMAETLAGLSGSLAQDLVRGHRVGTSEPQPEEVSSVETRRTELEEWEDHIQEEEIAKNGGIPETEKLSLVRARRGQGIFKERVMVIEKSCRLTKVENPVHLRASHIKPWRDSRGRNDERLDGENGLLLTPSMDPLFDRGFISFENDGELIISPRADSISLVRMGIPADRRINVGGFTEGQKGYLGFHRAEVLLKIAM